MDKQPDVMPITEPTAALEMAFIREYLRDHKPQCSLTPEQVERQWRDALLFAALKLEEISAKAHILKGLDDHPRCM
jgi:hypothetical protein